MKSAPIDERVGEPARGLLRGVGEAAAELRAVAEQPPELLLVERRGDDQHLADPGHHQRGQGVVDHRLVVHGHDLLGDALGDRVEPRAGAAGEDDPLQYVPPSLRWSQVTRRRSTNCSATRLAAWRAHRRLELRREVRAAVARGDLGADRRDHVDLARAGRLAGEHHAAQLRVLRRPPRPAACSAGRGAGWRPSATSRRSRTTARRARSTYQSGIRCGQPSRPLVAQVTVLPAARKAAASSPDITIWSRRLTGRRVPEAARRRPARPRGRRRARAPRRRPPP